MQQEGFLREHAKRGEAYEDVVCYGILARDYRQRDADTDTGTGALADS